MQKLNLVNIEKSDIKYEVFHFPDGEVHIKLSEINRKDDVNVICRITNAEELFILMQVGDILNRQAVDWNLNILYLMSMRMDRVIDFNEAYSLNVVASMIKSLNPTSISVMHPHSSKTLKLLNANDSLPSHVNASNLCNDKIQICFPDNGAYVRYIGSYASLTNKPILVGCKKRNLETGKIESIDILNPGDYCGCDIMVVDDLCDAGGTFMGIHQAIKKIDNNAKVSISLVHMVNERGIENLSRTFDKVYFTNTYKNWENLPDNCTMFDVEDVC